jgi:site-specific recombinase XerD
MNKNLNYYITVFFKNYLPNVIGVSNDTILSYRDSFKIFLQYIKTHYKKNINDLDLDCVTYDMICEFLLYLENERNNSISTRNQRLASIHSFYSFLQKRELSCFELCSQILSIPFKKTPKTNISYFSVEEVNILINLPNTSTKLGFRDYTLLLFMYETAARAREVSNLKKNQFNIQSKHSYVTIIGKGNKLRNIPITEDLAEVLTTYFQTFKIENDELIFKNKNENKITTKGIEYIMDKYINIARKKAPDKFKSHYSNHSMRHTRAMHLLESGVNLIYIRDILGHASVITTEIYAKTNPIIKEKQILEHSENIHTDKKYSQQEKEDLLEFLKKL